MRKTECYYFVTKAQDKPFQNDDITSLKSVEYKGGSVEKVRLPTESQGQVVLTVVRGQS